jgi:FKBP-type peptidyl-prolyl cis-trans isomerase 2
MRQISATTLACLLLPIASARAEEEKPSTVAAGRKVSIEYTLTLDGGEQADSNVGGEPLVYEQGASQILPALEEALVGMAVRESRKVTLPPERSYGPVRKELIREVDPQQIPEEARHAGAVLSAQDPQGQSHFARVAEVRADKIVVDMNHPLAGKTLHFEVKILSID